VKTRRIKNFIFFLFKEYGGRVKKLSQERGDKLRRKLLAVNGIGPETADSILLYAAGKPFFVIDNYTKRIFSRHGLFKADADYQSWQNLFVNALPNSVSLFNDFHAQIVNTAKQYCKASEAECAFCPLNVFFEKR